LNLINRPYRQSCTPFNHVLAGALSIYGCKRGYINLVLFLAIYFLNELDILHSRMFKISAESSDGFARTGVLSTGHGKVKTPFFMPVATKLSVKHISFEEVFEMGAKAVIANAFLTYLRPGLDVIRKAGGMHKFTTHKGIFFPDSGGFQMLSKHILRKVTDEGVTFRSPYDHKEYFVTPEENMALQQAIGSDVVMALDDVPSYGSTKEAVAASTRRTHIWIERCIKAHDGKTEYGKKQLLFGITQGGIFKDLREKSAKFMDKLDLDGIALGGLCIGEPKDKMDAMIRVQQKFLSKDKIKYLMGVGSPQDIVESVAKGIDVFDSVFPTRNARHHTCFTGKGNIRITNASMKDDLGPIDPECKCKVCKSFSRAYLYHLAKMNEFIYMRYLSYHNLFFLQNLMREIQKAIEEDRFEEYRKSFTNVKMI